MDAITTVGFIVTAVVLFFFCKKTYKNTKEYRELQKVEKEYEQQFNEEGDTERGDS